MSFEVYVQCLEASEKAGISRAAVRSLFPVEEESEHDYWHVRYDDKNVCHISVSPLAANHEMLKGFCVERPCADLGLWEALLTVLRMGSVVVFWPGGPPVVANDAVASILPTDMIDAIGKPKLANSAEQLLLLVQES